MGQAPALDGVLQPARISASHEFFRLTKLGNCAEDFSKQGFGVEELPAWDRSGFEPVMSANGDKLNLNGKLSAFGGRISLPATPF